MGGGCGGITMEIRHPGSEKYGLRAGSVPKKEPGFGKGPPRQVSWVKKMGEAFTGSKKVVPAGECVSTPATL